jgi:hypothetical protein
VISSSIAPSCTSPNTAGQIFSFYSSYAPSTYTLYTYGFTANDTSATLTFAMTGDSGPAHHYWLLDNVCVNDTSTNLNVLSNGDFELGYLSGWTQNCATNTNCGSGNYGQITTTSCFAGSFCFVDKCSNNNFDYLQQTFSTKAGGYYLISFYLKVYAPGGPEMVSVMLN